MVIHVKQHIYFWRNYSNYSNFFPKKTTKLLLHFLGFFSLTLPPSSFSP